MHFIQSKPLTVFSLFAGISMAILVNGCGSKAAPYDTRGVSGTSPSTAGGALGECTRVAANSAGLAGQMSTYYSGGAMVGDYLQLNISSYPAAQLTSTAYAQLYRWKEPTAGNHQVNSIPIRFFYVNKITGITLNSSPLNLISRSSVQNIIEAQKLDAIGITAANFFQNYYLVLTGMEMQWEAMSIAFYDSSQGTAAISSADILLPPFYASPVRYNAVVAVPSLQALHPLAKIYSSGASDSEFKRLSDEICSELFGQVRVPASIDVDDDQPSLVGLFHRLFTFFKNLFT